MDIFWFIIIVFVLECVSVLFMVDVLEIKINFGLSFSVIIFVWVGFCFCIFLRSNVYNICEGIIIIIFYEI